MISCSSKKLQYVLALISSIIFFIHLLNTSEENVILKGDNTLLVFLTYIFVIPGLLWAVFFWNRWLYDTMVFEDPNNPSITYEGFQCIMTVVMIVVTIIFIFT
jgi:membrane protein insertase Oxa1/YidC/SpoIIIJ